MSVQELLRAGPKPYLDVIVNSIDTATDLKVGGGAGTADQILRKSVSNALAWAVNVADFENSAATDDTASVSFVQAHAKIYSSLEAGTYILGMQMEHWCETARESIIEFGVGTGTTISSRLGADAKLFSAVVDWITISAAHMIVHAGGDLEIIYLHRTPDGSGVSHTRNFSSDILKVK